ncbi:hypothetical protein [Segatella copri]|uniref:Uncharacterized protein n=1 Tax=Segatella copri TaxID=165179 RepID=A0A3E5E2Y2_9BACT|nr:hypothetical protein [Segatella copri]RGN83057.1 hypothetical protein DXB41_07870 [Segatella copri]RGS17996.1 hypothetical protein DWY11_04230 [Segatella copri]
MKKLLFLLYLVCLPIAILAQDSVLGINFGNSYSSVKASLENRYGTLSVMEDKGTLRVFDISVGDYIFNMGEFDFQYSGSNSYFYYAEFQKNFSVNAPQQAKNFRENLRLTLSKKYTTGYTWINEQGYQCYNFAEPGTAPEENPSCTLIV